MRILEVHVLFTTQLGSSPDKAPPATPEYSEGIGRGVYGGLINVNKSMIINR